MLETYFSSVSGYVQQALDPILLRFVPDYKVQPGFPQFRRSCEVRPPDWESKNEVEMALTPRIQEVQPEKMTKTNEKNKIPHWPEPDGHQYDASMESGIWFATAEKESDISEERPLCRRNAKKYVRREKDDISKQIDLIIQKVQASLSSSPQIYVTIAKSTARVSNLSRNRFQRTMNNIMRLEPIPEHGEMEL